MDWGGELPGLEGLGQLENILTAGYSPDGDSVFALVEIMPKDGRQAKCYLVKKELRQDNRLWALVKGNADVLTGLEGLGQLQGIDCPSFSRDGLLSFIALYKKARALFGKGRVYRTC